MLVHATCMLAMRATRLRVGAALSRWYCRHRNRSAKKAVGAGAHRRLDDQHNPVQRITEHESGEMWVTVMDMARMQACYGRVTRGRGHQTQ